MYLLVISAYSLGLEEESDQQLRQRLSMKKA